MRRYWLGYLSVPVLLALASAASAVPITVPTGLNPGDPYRLAFVTSTTRDATSTDIAVYNTFVTSVANGVAALAALGTTWTAIGSTGTVDARDNTGTNPSATGVPIFLLNDVKLVDNNLDLWDGTIDVFFDVDETGATVPGVGPWTGTILTGASGAGSLGTTVQGVEIGRTDQTSPDWVEVGVAPAASARPMYALSGTLVVPEPATGVLLLLGLVAMAAARRRYV